MRHTLLSALVLAILAGCTGNDAGLGESCDRTSDCESRYQCMRGVCVDRCQRSPDCGDGYACDNGGICRLSEGRVGDSCKSEVDCEPGLSCQIDGTAVDDENRLRASCTASAEGSPAGGECFTDANCRNGTCALGHCVDLCVQTRDCASSNSCMVVPRVEAFGSLFGGCLPSGGNISWRIPVIAPSSPILLPVPSEASHTSLVFEVDDPQQLIGATLVTAPSGELLSQACFTNGDKLTCDPASAESQYYANSVRHKLQPGFSVLAMPSDPAVELETGMYYVTARSFRPNGDPGSAIPKVTAVVRIGSGGSLDLHLHFLDLNEHPCRSQFKTGVLDAAVAENESFFEQNFLSEVSAIFTTAGIVIGTVTYDDILDHPDLDGLDVSNAPALLKLGKYNKGINIFFVRSLSPVGLQGFGPAPGPAGLAKTAGSGIVIGVDTLCYRSWKEVARLTAHEIARYMGLYHNVEVNSTRGDPISDSTASPDNLMFYSELTTGTNLSYGQRDILLRSPVLQ